MVQIKQTGSFPYYQATQRHFTLQWKLLHQAVRSLLAVFWLCILALMYLCQLLYHRMSPWAVVCCCLMSLNNRLNFNISNPLEDITGPTRFNVLQLATISLFNILKSIYVRSAMYHTYGYAIMHAN